MPQPGWTARENRTLSSTHSRTPWYNILPDLVFCSEVLENDAKLSHNSP